MKKVINSKDLEAALRSDSAISSHPGISSLTMILAQIINGDIDRKMGRKRLSADPAIKSLLLLLSGKKFFVSDVSIAFGDGEIVRSIKIIVGKSKSHDIRVSLKDMNSKDILADKSNNITDKWENLVNILTTVQNISANSGA